MESYKEILKFWFEDIEPRQWFVKDENFDELLIEKYSKIHKEIIENKHPNWENKADSTLALILVLDQFSRNMFRDTPKAFEYDNLALSLAKKAIEKGFDKKVKQGRNFFYLPFMHSENLEDQKMCYELFKQMAIDNNDDIEKSTIYATQHMVIIEKFGRFPHRNQILGRETTKEEVEFLKQPNSSF